MFLKLMFSHLVSNVKTEMLRHIFLHKDISVVEKRKTYKNRKMNVKATNIKP